MISEETRRKLSESHKGQIPWNKGIKTGLKYWKGKKRSDETKKKLKLAIKRRIERDGYIISPESRKKQSLNCSNEKHWNWKGGISKNKLEWQRNHYKNLNEEQQRKTSWIRNKRNRVLKRIKNELGNHTFGEWELLKKQYNYTCPCCHKKESEIKLTEDHIIPLSKGGSDLIENIQPLCLSCNIRKNSKIIKY